MKTGSEPRTAKAAAAQFLQAALAGGPVPAAELSRMACEHGLTAKAIRAAREALDVKIARDGFGPGSKSLWSLPRGHIDAQPIPSEEEGGASSEGPNLSENRKPRSIDGYEVLGLSDEPCAYCGERGGPVYLMQALFKGVGREPLHETCAGYFFEFYSRINKRGGQV